MVSSPSRRAALLGIGSGVAGSAALRSGRLGVAESAGRSTETTPSSNAANDWPMARYDAAGTGYDPHASGPKDDPRVKWKRDLDDFSGGTGSPILLGDAVYAVGGGLAALDAATGDTRFVHEGSYRSSPARARASAYATDTLAVTSPRGVFGLDAGGGLRLLDRGFGVERWHGPGEEPEFSVFGPPTAVPPVASDGTVYAAVPGVGRVVALDASSGRVRWRRSPGDDLRRLAVRDGRVFAVNWPYRTTAYDADTGERLWKVDLPEQMVLAPTAAGDAVLVPDRRGVTALDPADGSVRWRHRHAGNATEGAAAVADGTVFVQSGGGDGALYALDLATGERRWSVPVPGEGTPVVADGVVYASAHRRIVAVDADTGEARWRTETRMPASTPAVGDGTLYVATHAAVLALEGDG